MLPTFPVLSLKCYLHPNNIWIIMLDYFFRKNMIFVRHVL